MPLDPARVKEVFNLAFERTDPAERSAYLARECADEPELRARVEALLRAAEQSDSQFPLLDSDRPTGEFGTPEPPLTETAPASTVETPGSLIAGRFKLIQEIGEGGMGSVWMAEQLEPVKRIVAVKLIKAGMDSKSVLVRFEAERQALALMDHPNIARVLDGGTAEHGRPFFVMELVKGVPINSYCDERQLPVRKRLELFIQVCQAVQHAHQKGIIHRDLKPSNVLVTEYDGKPVPKVIDFGLAKALQGPSTLTDHTLFTAFGAAVGTPLYMAPEQVGINSLDVDTRTDIYALGVLLYELLTGTTPLQKQRFKDAAWDEICRLIREEEPPRPSTRLSTLDALPSIAARRQTEPARLGRQVRGDLDWIAMKALEKDRNRRYETANGFAMDIQRYLSDEPVTAGPPSASYRLSKFMRRNRRGVRIAAAFAVLLALGIVGLIAGLAILNQRKQELERAVAAEAEARRKADDNFRVARTAVDRFFTEVSSSPELLRSAPGTQRLRKTLLEYARDYYLRFLNDAGDDPKLRDEVLRAHLRMGMVLAEMGSGAEAHKAYEQARDLAEESLRLDPTNRDRRRDWAAATFFAGTEDGRLGRLNEAKRKYQKAREQLDALVQENPNDLASKSLLSEVRRDTGELALLFGDPNEGIANLEAALNQPNLTNAFISRCRAGLARSYGMLGKYSDALREATKAREAMEKGGEAVLANTNLSLHLSRVDILIGHFQLRTQNLDEAMAAYERARIRLEPLARANPTMREIQTEYCAALSNVGVVHIERGNFPAGRLLLQDGMKRYDSMFAHNSNDFATVDDWLVCCFFLGHVEAIMGSPEQSLAALERATIRSAEIHRKFPNNSNIANNLVRCWLGKGNVERTSGRYEKAIAAYNSGLELSRPLCARNPRIPYYLHNLAGLIAFRAICFGELKKHTDAIEGANEAVRVCDDWLSWEPKSPIAREIRAAAVATRCESQILTGKHAEGLRDLVEILPNLNAAAVPKGKYLKILAQVKLNKFETLLDEAEELARTADGNPQLRYDAACAFALIAADRNAARRETAAKRSLELLRELKNSGTFDRSDRRAHFQQDTDFDALRQRADFKQFVEELLAKPASDKPH